MPGNRKHSRLTLASSLNSFPASDSQLMFPLRESQPLSATSWHVFQTCVAFFVLSSHWLYRDATSFSVCDASFVNLLVWVCLGLKKKKIVSDLSDRTLKLVHSEPGLRWASLPCERLSFHSSKEQPTRLKYAASTCCFLPCYLASMLRRSLPEPLVHLVHRTKFWGPP